MCWGSGASPLCPAFHQQSGHAFNAFRPAPPQIALLGWVVGPAVELPGRAGRGRAVPRRPPPARPPTRPAVVRPAPHITPALAEKILEERLTEGPPHERLSPREQMVPTPLAAGKTVSQIGQELSLSPRTVSTYRGRILEKMEMADNAELTAYALKRKLIF